MKGIVEIEEKTEASKRPSVDLEYQTEIVKKIKSDIQEKIKRENNNEEEKKKLKNDLERWNKEVMVLHNLLIMEQPREEDLEYLKTFKEMYQAIKEELETEEYKNDVEGLDVYYGKAKPSSEENAASYHDPFCECDELEPLSMEEEMYKRRDEDNRRHKDETLINVDDIPF